VYEHSKIRTEDGHGVSDLEVLLFALSFKYILMVAGL
jgi:hypothetical protein